MRIQQKRDLRACREADRFCEHAFDLRAIFALPFDNLRLRERVVIQPGVVMSDDLRNIVLRDIDFGWLLGR